MRNEIGEKFGDKLRVRVCGILFNEDQILMVKHRGLTSKGYLWVPPGGGAHFGQSVEDTLIREFKEETGLVIQVKDLLFVNEFHQSPLHALELFFQVDAIGGSLMKGYDPELPGAGQIIEEVRFWGKEDFQLENGVQLHALFRNLGHPQDILKLKGYFRNWK